MLIRTSGTVQPHLYLLTLGHTCRYAIGAERITLTNPGASPHAPLLIERLRSLNLAPHAIHRLVVTNLNADTVGALPALRPHLPNAQLVFTSAQAGRIRSADFLRSLYDHHIEVEKLGRTSDVGVASGAPEVAQPFVSFEQFAQALTPDKVVSDSEILECGDGIRLRLLALPGHTPESVGFMVEPYGYLIGDEVLGYYRGRELAAPGSDDSIELAMMSLKKLEKLPVTGLCLPSAGVLTGELVQKHLQAVALNTTDLEREVTAAIANNIPKDLILRSIEESFYVSESRDPFVLNRLKRTCEAIARRFALA